MRAEFFISEASCVMETYFSNIAGSAPDHGNKTNIVIK